MKPSKRSLPFIHALINVKQNKNKLALLRKFPRFVLDDILEILYNVVNQNCRITGKHVHILRKHKSSVSNLLNSALKKRVKSRHRVLYKQKGGFLATLLPIIASVLGSFF